MWVWSVLVCFGVLCAFSAEFSCNIGFGYSFIILCPIVCLLSCFWVFVCVRVCLCVRIVVLPVRQTLSIWMSQVWKIAFCWLAHISVLISIVVFLSHYTLNKQNNDIVCIEINIRKKSSGLEKCIDIISDQWCSFKMLRVSVSMFTQTTILFDWQNTCADPVLK